MANINANVIFNNKIGRSLYSHIPSFSWESFQSSDNFDSCVSPKMMISPVNLYKFELVDTHSISQLNNDKVLVRKLCRIFSSKSRFSNSKIDITCSSYI